MSDSPRASSNKYPQDNINEYWSEHAVAYDRHEMTQIHRGPAKQAWARALGGAMPTAPADVLDLGTGTGFVAFLLAELGYQVTGIDLASGMLAAAEARAAEMVNPPTFLTGDAVEPPFGNASFDVVTSRYLLWTLREPRRALANWKALLRPGGRLLAVDATWHSEGIHAGAATADASQREFLRLYDRTVISSLPLAEAQTSQTAAALVRDAGFCRVEVVPLVEIKRILTSAASHIPATSKDLRTPFLITGRNP